MLTTDKLYDGAKYLSAKKKAHRTPDIPDAVVDEFCAIHFPATREFLQDVWKDIQPLCR